MKWLFTVVLAGAVVGGGYFGFRQWSAHNQLSTSAKAELDRQASELQECEARLKQLHKAWQRYRADHKKADPPSIEALLPKYVKSPDHLLCPTAARWTKGGGAVEQGAVKWKGKTYPETYAFRWLAAGYAKTSQSQGEMAPLIQCSVHREVVYRVAYKKAPPLGSFDTEELSKLAEPVAKVPVLTVRKDGKVEKTDSSQM